LEVVLVSILCSRLLLTSSLYNKDLHSKSY
jgi:hypothetical protein